MGRITFVTAVAAVGASIVAGPLGRAHAAASDLTADPVPPARAAVELRPPAAAGAPAEDDKHPVLALGGLTAGYAVLYGWTFMAWHYHAETNDSITWADEGWFSADTYAGGADKLGHFWVNYALTRGGAQILERGGFSKATRLTLATGMSWGFFAFSELKDGYNGRYGFSAQDMVANSLGCALGLAMELSPWLDERLDLRMQYFPSAAFMEGRSFSEYFNSAEDYSGQTYILAYHLASIDYLRESPDLRWTRFIDLSVGYHAEAFLPHEEGVAPRQDLFVGVSFNLQQLFDSGFWRFTSEIYAPPFTTLPLVAGSRAASGQPTAAVITP